jgi:hypothetical protein
MHAISLRLILHTFTATLMWWELNFNIYETNRALAAWEFPVPSLARTRDRRVEPPERLRPASSPARVKGGHHVFGECPTETAQLLTWSTPCSWHCRRVLIVFLPATRSSRHFLCTASIGTTTTTKHHVAFGPALPQGIIVLTILFFQLSHLWSCWLVLTGW